jgi:membrane-bound metal-dependent hydrolase YbcI (DUF457 family)
VITGHLGIAGAVRSRWRDVSLLWLLPASIAPDILDVVLAAGGICSPYGLYTHTLPAATLLGALLGGIAFLSTGSRTAGLVVLSVVLLHLPADFVTGRKLFWPGGPLMGLDLYRRPALDFLVELPVLVGGWWLLRRAGAAPRLATSLAAVCALVAVQGVFDLMSKAVKPTACYSAAVDEQ